MRKSFWKIFLTCLMLVAIPLQGFAGVRALVCAGHHQTLYGVGSPAQPPASAGSDSMGHAHTSHASDAGDSDKATHTHTAHQKCGGCGPCCIGAVLSSSVQPTIVSLDGKTDFPSLASRHASPAVRGLDRPPQTLLA